MRGRQEDGGQEQKDSEWKIPQSWSSDSGHAATSAAAHSGRHGLCFDDWPGLILSVEGQGWPCSLLMGPGCHPWTIHPDRVCVCVCGKQQQALQQ
ncbi:hypothetical protein TREES_T100007667 [Tupaia chinensis]|uniref:Uncharacterized protein n=1 Tax=Tupaia chinensis TaxID=246437 RepID=L9KT11_TUPCH|nr:hypothetical protein TREES_T100007667 [Tupaia chinensis]